MQNDFAVKIKCIAFSPLGDFFAFGGNGGSLKIYETRRKPLFIETGLMDVPQKEFVFKMNVSALAFGVGKAASRRLTSRIPSRRLRDRLHYVHLLAVGLTNGSIRIIDLEKMDVYLVLEDHRRSITSMSFSVDGSLTLASSSLDGTCKLWDLWDDGNMYRTLRDSQTDGKACFGCAWSPDGKSICVAGGPHNALVWNTEAFKLEGRLIGHKHSVTGCDFSHDNTMIATSSMDTSVIVWDRKSLLPFRQLWHMGFRPSMIYLGGANGYYVTKVTFSKDNVHLATVCDDRSVRVWNLDDGSTMESELKYSVNDFNQNEGHFTDAQFSPDGHTLMMSFVGAFGSMVCRSQAPIQNPYLMFLCRSALRRKLSSQQIAEMHLPGIIKRFLCFEHNSTEI